MLPFVLQRALYYATFMWIPRNMQVWGMKRTIDRAFKIRSTQRAWVFFFCWSELQLLEDLNKWWAKKGGSDNPFIVGPRLFSVSVEFQRPLTVQEQQLVEELARIFDIMIQTRKASEN